jgi:hypothetical protein
MTIRGARVANAPKIARVHVDSWRSTYAGIVPANFLASMSCERFEARWCGWMGAPGRDGIFYVAELPSARIVELASGGPRKEERYPEYEGEPRTELHDSRMPTKARRLTSGVLPS